MRRSYCQIKLPGLPEGKNFLGLIILDDWGDDVKEIQTRVTIGHVNIVCSAVSHPNSLFDYHKFRQWIKAAYRKQRQR